MTTTSLSNDDKNSRPSVLQLQRQRRHHKNHHLTNCSDSLQHQPSPSTDADSTKRKSPSIFSSVEELARGSSTTQPTPIISSLGHVTSTPITAAQRSPIVFDLSTDSGYCDSSIRDVTSSLYCTPEVATTVTDDVITTLLKWADFRPITVKRVAADATVLRHQIISVASVNPIATDVSKTRLKEKLQPGSEISAMLPVAMETATTPEIQRQPQENAQPIHDGYDVKNPHLMPGKSSPLLTAGRNYVENEDKLELIRGGFGVKNQLLTRTTDPNNNSPQLNSKNSGKSD